VHNGEGGNENDGQYESSGLAKTGCTRARTARARLRKHRVMEADETKSGGIAFDCTLDEHRPPRNYSVVL
jgi:hypothetical protein